MGKRILQYLLRFLAKRALRKHKPKIIGITGNVGKTGAKEAVYLVLKQHLNTRKSEENHNNAIGVPLTILGLMPGGSVFAWLKKLWQGLKVVYEKSYPEILVLEMGIDKPGDMKYLTDFISVDAAIMTAIGKFPAHLEFFPDREALINEKKYLINAVVPQSGSAVILNYDDPSVRAIRTRTVIKTIRYGFKEGADLKISNFSPLVGNLEKGEFGMNFKLDYKGSVVPVRLNKVFGRQQALSAAAAAAVGLSFDLNLVDISTALAKFRSLAGRGVLIKGIKKTWIIDSSYNSSPAAAVANLKMLDDIAKNMDCRKIAVLGDMLELGAGTEAGHRRVGRQAAENADVLLTVGDRARFIADEALKGGMSRDRVFEFTETEKAGLALQEMLRPGDIILVKASRSMSLEKIIKEVMAEPEKADKLLAHS